jgi:hypothetical protein
MRLKTEPFEVTGTGDLPFFLTVSTTLTLQRFNSFQPIPTDSGLLRPIPSSHPIEDDDEHIDKKRRTRPRAKIALLPFQSEQQLRSSFLDSL